MPMGRHRKSDRHLPALVSLERGTYYFRSGKSPRVNLGRDFADAMRRYGALVAPAPMATMVGVIDRYKREQLPSKAERTQAEYRAILDELRTVFGKMNPNAITANMVKQFRDGSLENPRGDVQANLARAVFGTVMAWAIEWGAASFNPVRDTKRRKIAKRTRNVDDADWHAVYGIAAPMLQCAMDLALLTGLRRGDLLRLDPREHLKDDGLHITTQKTKTALVIEYSDELRAVLKRALSIGPRFRRTSIITNDHGARLSPGDLGRRWWLLQTKAFPKGQEHRRFRWQDIRAKSATESASIAEASARLGHSTQAVTARHYMRGARVVKPLR
jgi:integrase